MEEENKRRRGRPPRVRDPETEEETLMIADEGDPGFERVVVARGRNVILPHPTRTKLVGETEDGRPRRAPVQVICDEGDEIEIDREEAERLIALGIVHKPGQPQVIPAALSEGSRVVEIGNPRGQQSPINQAMRT